MEDRTSLLERIIRFEPPVEDTVAMLAAYGWASDHELVFLTPADVISILDRFLEGELTDRQVAYWAELLEMREDVGFELVGKGSLAAGVLLHRPEHVRPFKEGNDRQPVRLRVGRRRTLSVARLSTEHQDACRTQHSQPSHVHVEPHAPQTAMARKFRRPA